MADQDLLQRTIERIWDTIPPVWGQVRGNARFSAVHDFHITLEQFHILRHIHRGAHSVAELAERKQISRPAISQAIDLLVDKGLITRTQGKPDRRFVQLELTESGNNMISAIFQNNRRWMANQMSGLTTGELDTLLRALDILKATFSSPND